MLGFAFMSFDLSNLAFSLKYHFYVLYSASLKINKMGW